MSKAKSLWVPADTITARFFTQLAGGPFGPTLGGESLATAYPDLARVAHYWRPAADENAFRAATPDAVALTGLSVTPAENLNPFLPDDVRNALAGAPGQQVVVVETSWKRSKVGGVYDSGSTLRLGPNQALLFTNSPAGPQMHLPVGWSQGGGFSPYDTPNAVAVGITGQGDRFGLTYLIPGNETPTTLYARGLRLPLAIETTEDAPQIARLFRQLGAGEGTSASDVDASVPWLTSEGNESVFIAKQGSNAGAAWAGVTVERTNALPGVGSVNNINAGGRVRREGQSPEASPGTDAFFAGRGSGDGLIINALSTGGDRFTMLRVKVTPRAVNADLGTATAAAGAAAAATAGTLNPVVEFTDAQGNKWGAVAYAVMDSTSRAEFGVYYAEDPNFFGQALGIELRGPRLQADTAELYLYFRVPPGTEITQFQLARNAQDARFYVARDGESQDGQTNAGNAATPPAPAGNTPPPAQPSNGRSGPGGLIPDVNDAPGAGFGL